MNASSITARINAEHAAIESRLPEAVMNRTARRKALGALVAHGLPSARDDAWKYAALRPLERIAFAPPGPDVPALPAAALPEPLPGFTRIVFVDGRFAPKLSADVSAIAGLSIGRSDDSATSDDPFALLNDVFALDAVTLVATEHSPAVEIVWFSSGHGAAYPRASVRVPDGTRLALLERFVSAPESATLSAPLTRIAVGRDARLDHYRLQALTPRATHFETLDATVAAGGTFALHAVSVGAQSARATWRIRLEGVAAGLEMYAATVAEGTQVNDVQAIVEHAAPRTRTQQIFRGIAADRARVAFNGHIVVAAGSKGADSSQSLRGLLAGAQAEIDTRPQLEIYTDDVRCSHGATAGKLDDTMLFYLLSRGIDRDTAQSLLKWAFLEDAVSRAGNSAVRGAFERVLASHLRDATVSGGLL